MEYFAGPLKCMRIIFDRDYRTSLGYCQPVWQCLGSFNRFFFPNPAQINLVSVATAEAFGAFVPTGTEMNWR